MTHTSVDQPPPPSVARDRIGFGSVELGTSVPALLLGAAALVPLLVIGYIAADVYTAVVLKAVSLTLLSLAGVRLVAGVPHNDQGIARWRIGPWYPLWMAFSLGMASLTWLGAQTGSASIISLSSVSIALTIAGVSVTVWTAGYLLGPPKPVRDTAGRMVTALFSGTKPEIRGGAIPWVFFAVGTAARFASVVLDRRFGYVGDPSVLVAQAKPYTNALNILSTAAVFGVAVAAYRAFSTGRPSAKLTLWILVTAEAVVGALGGIKESFVVSVLAVLVPYGAIRGRLSLRIIAVGALIFLWIILPFNVAYRAEVRTRQSSVSPATAFGLAPGIFADVATGTSEEAGLVRSTHTLLLRVRDIDNIAIIAQLTPGTIAYRSPTEFALMPVVGFIPRAVWPNKPILATGYRFSQEYYGLPSNVYTSSAVTPTGDLYRHGGWPSLLVGMLLLGAGCRLFDTLFRPERDPRAIFFVLVFLPMLVKSEVDIYTMIVSVPTGIITATLGVHLACREWRFVPTTPVRP